MRSGRFVANSLLGLVLAVSLSACIALNETAVSTTASDPSDTTVDTVVTASNNSGAGLAAPSIAFTGGISGLVGQTISSVSPVNNGGIIASCSITPDLPADTGLSFDATTCAVSGTPNRAMALTTYTLTATNATGSSTATFAAQILGSVSSAIFDTQPAGAVTAGSPFSTQPVVRVLDSGGNALAGVSVSLSVFTAAGCTSGSSATGTLTGASATTGVSGIATFTALAYTRAEAIYLKATAEGVSVCSGAITVTAGAASKLAFSTLPSASSYAGVAFATQPVVVVQDANGNSVSSSVTVTLSPYLSANCSTTAAAGVLDSASAIASSGIATFAGLSHSVAEVIYLNATASGLTSACTSSTVTINAYATLALPSSNRILWLKADALSLNDGDLVSTWTDSSAAPMTVSGTTTARPTYVTNVINGKPVVRFGGAHYLKIPDAASLRPSDITIISVFKRNASTGAWAKLIQRPHYTDSTWSSPYSSWGVEARNSSGTAWGFYTASSGNVYNSAVTSSITENAFHLLTAIQSGASKTVYSDMSSVYSGTATGALNYGSYTGQQTWIGAGPAGEYLNGDIAELIVYSSALSASNRAMAECYLNAKYALGLATCTPTLTPKMPTVAANESIALVTSNGIPPYIYDIQSGSGSIDSNGVFTAASSAGTVVARVTDYVGTTNTLTITVAAAGSASIVSSGLTLNLDAAYASGSGFPGTGCGTTTWSDLAGTRNGTLTSFSSCGTSLGWNGDGATSGAYGTATGPYRLSYDGASAYVAAGSMGTRTTAGTIEVWFRSAAVENYRNLFDTNFLQYSGCAQGFRSEQNSSSSISFNAGNDATSCTGGVTVSSSLTNGGWHHFVGTWDSSTSSLKGYFDGTLASSTSNTGWATSLTNIAVGAGWSTGRIFKGDIAKFAIYNRALSANQVARNCNALQSRFSGVACATYISAPTQLVLAGPSTISSSSSCSTAFTVTAKDGGGNTVETPRLVTISLSGLGAATAYSDSSCTTQISTLALPVDSSSATFYLRDSTLGDSLSIVAADAAGSLSSSSSLAYTVVDGDQYWNSVVLLMAMDGSSSSFTESRSGLSVSNPNTILQAAGPTGFGNSATFSSTQKGLSVPDSSSWTIGTDAYTVEGRVKFTTLPGSGGFASLIGSFWPGYDTNWHFYLYNNGSGYLLGLFHGRQSNGGIVNTAYYSSAVPVVADTWHSIAFTYDGSNVRHFFDGVLVGTAAQSIGFGDSSTSIPMQIGSDAAQTNYLTGEMDEVRITKGVCRYTTTYTPSTSSFKAY